MKDRNAKNGGWKHWMKEKFNSIDMFGQPISLTWNGEEEYKTSLGAALSTILIIVLLAYSGTRLA